MNRWNGFKSLIRLLTALAAAAALGGCGFVTAPLALAGAGIAGGSVKAAEYSLDKGQQAAIYLRNRSVDGARVSVEFLGTAVDDLGSVLQREDAAAARRQGLD